MLPQDCKILFFGTPEFAVPSLIKLKMEGYNLLGVVTQPDKPVGRKQELTPSPVKATARQSGIKIFEPNTLKDEEVKKNLEAIKPDLIIVVAYGKLLPQWLLKLPPFGCVNVHPSLLPKHRGPSPIQAAILTGDDFTGVSIMLLDEEMDHGPILADFAFSNPLSIHSETGGSLSQKLADFGADKLIQTLPPYLDRKLSPKPQEGTPTFTKILTRDDGKIEWNKPAIEIERMVRAYNPWPGAWFELDGKRLKVLAARIYDGKNMDVCGTIWKTENGELAGATKTSGLVLVTVQPEGGKVMPGEDFARGNFKK